MIEERTRILKLAEAKVLECDEWNRKYKVGKQTFVVFFCSTFPFLPYMYSYFCLGYYCLLVLS